MSQDTRKNLFALLMAAACLAGYWQYTHRGAFPLRIVATLPVPGDGRHVLIIEETEQRGDLPESQRSALFDPALRKWLRGKDIDFRLLDQNDPATDEGGWFAAAVAIPHPTLPWLVASNGKSGISAALQADTQSIERQLSEVFP